MTHKFTAGPWETNPDSYGGDPDDYLITCLMDDNAMHVAVVCNENPCVEANAVLIAAAPILSALKGILRRLGDIEAIGEWSALDVNHGMSKKLRSNVDADIAIARAAIAKALGESA